MTASRPGSSSGRKTCRPPPDCVISAAHTRNSPACPIGSWLPWGQLESRSDIGSAERSRGFTFRQRENHQMRIAVLCDIHGNVPALQAVLTEVEKVGVDLVVFGGDGAAGPMPVETIEGPARYNRPAPLLPGHADPPKGEAFHRQPQARKHSDSWP